MSPSPIPVPSPPAGGANWNPAASGTNAASGTDFSASGPWMIEKQTLDIDYVRVPLYGYHAASACDLSSHVRTAKVTGTKLLAIVRASYSKTKSYDPFDTSSFQQSQSFKYLPVSADYLGNSYGDMSNTGGSALGPAGSIVTLTPWYQRRDWNDDIDAEIYQSCEGTRHFFGPKFTASSAGELQDGVSLFDDEIFLRTIPPHHAHTFLDDNGLSLQGASYPYKLTGPYNVDQETPEAIVTFIEWIAQWVRHETLYGVGENFTVKYEESFGGWIAQKDTGISNYRSDRHSYY